jgi:hypothetical protein
MLLQQSHHVLKALPDCVTLLLHCCNSVVTLLLYCCYIFVTLMPHCCDSVIALLLTLLLIFGIQDKSKIE